MSPLGSSAQEAATLRQDAAAVLREVAAAARVYVVAHVCDDVGEATVRGALEAGGLVGGAPDQVRRTRQAVMAGRQHAARWSLRPCGLRVPARLQKPSQLSYVVSVLCCCTARWRVAG